MLTSIGGLIVNLIGLVFFHDVGHTGHDHGHDHKHDHTYDHHDHDHNDHHNHGSHDHSHHAHVFIILFFNL